jgi:hypothetical protein
VRGELAGRVGEVHDLRGGRAVLAAEHAVAEPEVQGRADHDDEVAAAEGLAAGLGHQQRVSAGDHAAAHAVGHHRDRQRLDQPQRRLLRAVGPHVGAEHQHRAARAGQQGTGRVQRVRVRLDPLPWGYDGPVHGGLVEELVHRHVEEGGAAVRGAGDGERLVDRSGHLGDLVHGP